MDGKRTSKFPGVDTFTKETVLTPVTAIGVVDSGAQVAVSDTGLLRWAHESCLATSANGPASADLHVGADYGQHRDLGRDGRARRWVAVRSPKHATEDVEWRQDQLVMPGSTQSADLRLRYKGAHAVFVAPTDTLLFRGGTGPIAYKTVSTYLVTKNPEASQLAKLEADDRVSQLATRNARMKQRELITRASYGNTARGRFFFATKEFVKEKRHASNSIRIRRQPS